MIIESISTDPRKNAIWDHPLVKLLFLPLLVIIILVVLIALICGFIYNATFGRWTKKPVSTSKDETEDIFYDNGKLKITIGAIPNEDVVWISEFMQEAGFRDDAEVYCLLTNVPLSEINEHYFTEYKMVTPTELIMQEVFLKNGNPTSQLIAINKETGGAISKYEIGAFYLHHFDYKKEEIKGYDKASDVSIKLRIKGN